VLEALDWAAPNHARVTDVVARAGAPLPIPTAILSEIASMLERGGRQSTLARLLTDIERGALVLDCGDADIPRIQELIARYVDLPPGLADAAVIACAERNGGLGPSLDRDCWIVGREARIRILPD
jgi:predicted nucleic acid-binding protein